MRDPLTGLPNRRALQKAMSAVLIDYAAGARPHALMFLDLNGFKRINDEYGHPVGDRILEIIARRMQSAVDDADVVARLGGDEFAVFCRSVEHLDDIRQLAHRLIAGIEAPIDIAGTLHRVGAGVGIAFHPQDGRIEQELFRCADAALYRAKAAKQSAVHCYS